jgi:hypothetical protein
MKNTGLLFAKLFLLTLGLNAHALKSGICTTQLPGYQGQQMWYSGATNPDEIGKPCKVRLQNGTFNGMITQFPNRQPQTGNVCLIPSPGIGPRRIAMRVSALEGKDCSVFNPSNPREILKGYVTVSLESQFPPNSGPLAPPPMTPQPPIYQQPPPQPPILFGDEYQGPPPIRGGGFR